MSYRGKVENGVVVFDDPGALPDGAEVWVEVVVGRIEPADVDLLAMSDLAFDTGIPDLATNIDHYLYGHPKIDESVHE